MGSDAGELGVIRIRDTTILLQLKSDLTRHTSQARRFLSAAFQQVDDTRSWLETQRASAAGQRDARDRALAQAQAALEQCRQMAVLHGVGLCAGPAHDVAIAHQALREAEARLAIVESQIRRFEQAAAQFETQASRLKAFLDDVLPRANADLEHHIAAIAAFQASGHGIRHQGPLRPGVAVEDKTRLLVQAEGEDALQRQQAQREAVADAAEQLNEGTRVALETDPTLGARLSQAAPVEGTTIATLAQPPCPYGAGKRAFEPSDAVALSQAVSVLPAITLGITIAAAKHHWKR